VVFLDHYRCYVISRQLVGISLLTTAVKVHHSHHATAGLKALNQMWRTAS
jgi:hypothetical protein